MDLNTVKKSFLSFFGSKDHLIQDSASLIPANDDSLLFVNAGMVPFKPFFLNQSEPPATNLASCQRCIRAGGKHNDLDQVGYTKRHHTFFEMCGNFSFGGYAHREAIELAWEYLTEVLKLDQNRLYVTVHPDDSVSYKIWAQIVNRSRIYQLVDNEWSMGTNGPCGMCTEIFYDHGDHLEGSITEGDRFVEIWNLVIMTHEVTNGEKSPLEKTCIDTGMGLERITAVLNGTDDNYNIPFFRNIMEELSKMTGQPIGPAFKILIDHARAAAFAISDGVITENWGRGYVLRKIIRRALKNGALELFERCINYTIDTMGVPELAQARNHILEIIRAEADLLQNIINSASGNIAKLIGNASSVSGSQLYTLYERYGISPDIIQEVNSSLELELDEFDAVQSSHKGMNKKSNLAFNSPATEFFGYQTLVCDATVLDVIEDADTIYLITDKTVFYAEAGGQEADHGTIIGADWDASVLDVVKSGEVHVHKITYTGKSPHGQCTMRVDPVRRQGLAQHHSATHLLAKALELILGEQVTQQGSLVKADGLRFDFAYPKQIEDEVLFQIEQKVNEWIQQNVPTKVSIQALSEAKAGGASSMRGEKYPDKVRVVEIADSKELCCGTHVTATGDIGSFYIVRESSARALVRRIEARAGMGAYQMSRHGLTEIQQLCTLLKTNPEHLFKSVQRLLVKPKENKEVLDIIEGSFEGKAWVIATYEAAPQQTLLKLSDKLAREVDYALIVNYTQEKTGLLFRGLHAKSILSRISSMLSGTPGGGRPDLAQAGVPGNPSIEEFREVLLVTLAEAGE